MESDLTVSEADRNDAAGRATADDLVGLEAQHQAGSCGLTEQMWIPSTRVCTGNRCSGALRSPGLGRLPQWGTDW